MAGGGWVGGGSVGASVDGEQSAVWVGEQPAPGAGGVGGDAAGEAGRDGSVSVQFAGLLIEAEQGGGGDADLDRRLQPAAGLPPTAAAAGAAGGVAAEGVVAELDQGVGAALVGAAGITGCPGVRRSR